MADRRNQKPAETRAKSNVAPVPDDDHPTVTDEGIVVQGVKGGRRRPGSDSPQRRNGPEGRISLRYREEVADWIRSRAAQRDTTVARHVLDALELWDFLQDNSDAELILRRGTDETRLWVVGQDSNRGMNAPLD
jgi:hypothetical protein